MRTTDESGYRTLTEVSVWTGSGYDTMLLGEVEDGIGHVAYSAERVMAASNGTLSTVEDAARALLTGDYDEWQLHGEDRRDELEAAHGDAIGVVDAAMSDRMRFRGHVTTTECTIDPELYPEG